MPGKEAWCCVTVIGGDFAPVTPLISKYVYVGTLLPYMLSWCVSVTVSSVIYNIYIYYFV